MHKHTNNHTHTHAYTCLYLQARFYQRVFFFSFARSCISIPLKRRKLNGIAFEDMFPVKPNTFYNYRYECTCARMCVCVWFVRWFVLYWFGFVLYWLLSIVLYLFLCITVNMCHICSHFSLRRDCMLLISYCSCQVCVLMSILYSC